MTYEKLISTLKEYCLNNVPTNYNSIINTVGIYCEDIKEFVYKG